MTTKYNMAMQFRSQVIADKTIKRYKENLDAYKDKFCVFLHSTYAPPLEDGISLFNTYNKKIEGEGFEVTYFWNEITPNYAIRILNDTLHQLKNTPYFGVKTITINLDDNSINEVNFGGETKFFGCPIFVKDFEIIAI